MPGRVCIRGIVLALRAVHSLSPYRRDCARTSCCAFPLSLPEGLCSHFVLCIPLSPCRRDCARTSCCAFPFLLAGGALAPGALAAALLRLFCHLCPLKASFQGRIQKKPEFFELKLSGAERGGFEPPVPTGSTTVFETAPFDHSGISPSGTRIQFKSSISGLSANIE